MDQLWHYHLKAHHQPLPNQEYTNETVNLVKPDRGLSWPQKHNGSWTPDFFGRYNMPDKRLGCCKAKGTK